MNEETKNDFRELILRESKEIVDRINNDLMSVATKNKDIYNSLAIQGAISMSIATYFFGTCIAYAGNYDNYNGGVANMISNILSDAVDIASESQIIKIDLDEESE